MQTKEWDSRVRMWLGVLKKRIYNPMEEIAFTYQTTMEHLPYEEAMAGTFAPIQPGDVWGQEWEYGWFRSEFHLGPWAMGKRIVADLTGLNCEATLFLNGQVWGTRRREWVHEPLHFLVDNWLTRNAQGDESYLLVAECYAGHQMPPDCGNSAAGPLPGGRRWVHRPDRDRVRLETCTVGTWDEEVYRLYLEMKALYEIAQNGDPDSLRVSEVEGALRELTMRLDLTLEGNAFAANVRECRAFLQPCLQCYNGSTAPVIHAIGHAHIDLAWLWPTEETERKGARTMAAQLRHMDEYPEYKMIQSQPALYEMIRKHYPALFEKMKEKVAAGQLIPEGGMWVEADTNIPSGESLVRQFLYGKRYFREMFGVEDRMLWLPDVFGYSAALPQIMQGCGVDCFATAKIFWAYNGGEPFPYNYFNWVGVDGTAVRSIIHMDYSSETGAGFSIQKWRGRRQREGIKRLMAAVGYGDGGGGPTRDHIENVRLLADCEGVPQLRFDSPTDVFDLYSAELPNPPEYVGELYFQAHRGTYTTQARTKRLNRKCELALREAEVWSAIAAVCGKMEYPRAALEEDWKTVLFNQFHDVIPGSSIHRVYERANRQQAAVLEEANHLARQAVTALGEQGKDCLSVFNSLSWPRRVQVALPEGWDGAAQDGVSLPVQRTASGVTAELTVPSVGAVSITPCLSIPEGDGVFFRDGVLENDVIRACLNERGEITSLLDKETGIQWAAGPMNVLRLYQDIPAHYENWDIDSMRPEVPVSGESSLTVLAEGPLFCEVQVRRTIGKSSLAQTIRLERSSRQITFRTKVDWQETQKLLKVDFPAAVQTDELISEIQYGHIKRPNHTSRQLDRDRFEVCNHKWSALAEADRYFAILNDCKYGISAVHNTMSLTLLRAPVWPDESADLGNQTFLYAVTFGDKPLSRSDVVQAAYALNIPALALEGIQCSGSIFQFSDPHIILDCGKLAEDSDGLVLRLYESSGSARTCTLHTALPFVACTETNMLEEPQRELPVQDGAVQLTFRAFEVKTLILSIIRHPRGDAERAETTRELNTPDTRERGRNAR